MTNPANPAGSRSPAPVKANQGSNAGSVGETGVMGVDGVPGLAALLAGTVAEPGVLGAGLPSGNVPVAVAVFFTEP
ncbi:hypothetical protein, partial [Arthrobacter sp. AZCC_0090]|uniref:hypothetical protein n=1 Tax=Arthrobacter sp. AZCC_0090 TaxID=2735881 RepID=UPI00160FBB37